jgi:hypothetical protein
MAHMPRMPTRELRDPMALLILMKADDRLLHGFIFGA